jgi:hypothetical protein
MPDPNFDEIILLKTEACDQVLGESLLTMLERSRRLSLSEADDIWNEYILGGKYKEQELKKMQALGFESEKALLKSIKYVSASLVGLEITLQPTISRGGRSFQGSNELEDVIVTRDQEPVELGRAVRLALSRCR